MLDGLIEVAWTDPQNDHALSQARLFDSADFADIPDFAAGINRQGCNIYIGAALRKPGIAANKRASDADFLALTAAYVDLDEPGTPENASSIYKNVMPTLAVITGRHPHFRAQLWWRLEDLETDPQIMRRMIGTLAGAMDGDTTVVNPSRVMRLGGTIAWPVKEGRIAEVTEVQHFNRPDLPGEAVLNGIRREISTLPQLPQTQGETPSFTPPSAPAAAPILNLPDFNNISVDGCIAAIRSGHHWHNNMVKLTAHWINRGMSDEEILLAAESLTTGSYTAEQTRREVTKMLQGGRAKWGIENPNILLQQQQAESAAVHSLILKDWNGHRYEGRAPEQRWLVQNAIPLGVPIILAAMGGVGKSFMALDLALHVSMTTTTLSFPYTVFGGALKEHGSAVILAAEDSYETIHRRFNRIDEHDKRVLAGDRLVVVPMPSVGGPRPLIDVEGGVPGKTAFFEDLKLQLQEMDDLKLIVVDPLQAFVMADVTSDPAAGQYMWSSFAELSAETGATVIVTHHMRKDGMHNISSVAGARESIRGSTALVDGARGAYALWQADAEFARLCCAHLGREYEENIIVQGAIVKTNDEAFQDIHTYVRQESGLLIQDNTLSDLDETDLGWPDYDAQISILKEIEARWNKGEPLSHAPNTGNRYIIKYLRSKIGLTKSVAGVLVNKWIDEDIISVDIVNRSTKLKGYRLIKYPEKEAEGAETWSLRY